MNSNDALSRGNNKTSVLIMLLVFAVVGVFAQSYQIGHTTLSFIDTSRNNRQVPTEVYYPALAAGEDVPVASGQFPVLSFGHGFVITINAYSNFRDAMVPRGYILALPNTETGLLPDHLDLALDLSFILKALDSAHLNSGSIFFGHIDPHAAVMGHSMGGGAAMLAASGDSSITAVVNFAAANTNPSAILAATSIYCPALLFAGSEDCVTPPLQHQEPMYDSLASPIKTLITITGGGHCYFANYNFFCAVGEASCTPNPTISREEQQDVTFDFLNLWLDCYLKGDQDSFEIFLDSLTSSPRIDYQHKPDDFQSGNNNDHVAPPWIPLDSSVKVYNILLRNQNSPFVSTGTDNILLNEVGFNRAVIQERSRVHVYLDHVVPHGQWIPEEDERIGQVPSFPEMLFHDPAPWL